MEDAKSTEETDLIRIRLAVVVLSLWAVTNPNNWEEAQTSKYDLKRPLMALTKSNIIKDFKDISGKSDQVGCW